MRNYPSVPNVFRVGSSLSVDNEATYTPGTAGNLNTTSGSNNNSNNNGNSKRSLTAASVPVVTDKHASIFPTTTSLQQTTKQQQQQQQQLHQINRTQQSLANVSKTTAGEAPTTGTTRASMYTITNATTGGNAFGSSYENEQHRNKQYQQQQQQQQQHLQLHQINLHNQQQQHQQQQQQMRHQFHVGQSVNGNASAGVAANDAIMNKLTTTASVECSNYQNGRDALKKQQQLQQQHSQYATLPRTISGVVANGDLRQSNNNGNRNISGNFNGSGNGNGSGSRRTVAGVINTISGSIPATGFAINGHATSVGSDLNLVLNNSCADLNKLNVDAQQQQQRREQQQQQHEDYRFTRMSRDADEHEFSLKKTTKANSRIKSNYCNNNNNNNSNNSGYLWILTPVAASISVAIVIAALAGPQWLFTEEKLPNPQYNGTEHFTVLDESARITKYTKSSLWILCTTMQGVETYNCIKIDYFSSEGYQPDPQDSTSAIPYTVTKSCPFFLASGIALLISFIVFLIPTCSHQNSLYYFTAGILFIVSGLLMLIGLIAYISILKAEIGSKLRPRSALQPALFKVNYGQSFFLFVFGFIATEFVGLLNIFLYISLQEVSYYSRLPCFTLSNIREKIKEGKNPRSQTYKSYKHPSAQTNGNERKAHQQRRNVGGGGGHHQVHNVRAPMLRHLSDDVEQQKSLSKACRRHPNAPESTNFRSERRYYFDDTPSVTPCTLHSRNLAKSLNELYMDPSLAEAEAETAAPPPPPSTIRAGTTLTFPRHLPQQQRSPSIGRFGDLPQEFPLTRSVSTTTEIFQSSNDFGVDLRGATPHLERRSRQRNMATNTRPTDTEMMRTECSGTRQLATNRRQANEPSNNKSNSNNNNKNNNGNNNGNSNVNGNGNDNCNSNENFNSNSNDDGDNDDVVDNFEQDEDEPQRLCGLKRGIRKTKDELFQEFCKRAGVRPKPKNIYYIANEEEMLHRQRQNGEHRKSKCGSGVSGLSTVADDMEFEDEDEGNESGDFKRMNTRIDQFYSVEPDTQHISEAMKGRSMRRASMFVEPIHLRKLNSNLSLHTLYPPDNHAAISAYQKGFQDASHVAEYTSEVWPIYPAPHRSAYGGSQNRLDSNTHLNQSRSTLPRTFMRNNGDSQDSIASLSLQALNNAYSASQTRLSNLMLHPHTHTQQQQQQQHQLQLQQQKLQQQNQFLTVSRGASGYLHKSYDDLNATNYLAEPTYNAVADKLPNISGAQQAQQQSQQPTIQWPAAIPSSPSHFGANYSIYGVTSSRPHPPIQHAAVSRSASGGGNGSTGNGQSKFQRAFAFDEHRRSSAVNEAFDLDEIERDRRRSHASLFNGVMPIGTHGLTPSNGTNNSGDHYDIMNGTAV